MTQPVSDNSPSESTTEQKAAPRIRRSQRPGATVAAQGEPMLWLTAGGLVVCVVMIVSLIALILWQGFATFWPSKLLQVQTISGETFLGELTQTDRFLLNYSAAANLEGEKQAAAYKLLNASFRDSLAQEVAGAGFTQRVTELSKSAISNVRGQVSQIQALQEASSSDRDELLAELQKRLDAGAASFAEKLNAELKTATAADQTGEALFAKWSSHRDRREEIVNQADVTEFRKSAFEVADGVYDVWATEMLAALSARVAVPMQRRMLRTGNYELTNEHFTWISDFEVAANGESLPEWAILFERLAWGRFYGLPKALIMDDKPVETDPAAIWKRFNELHSEVRARWRERRELELHEIGNINRQIEDLRLGLREVELDEGTHSDLFKQKQAEVEKATADFEGQFESLRQKIAELDQLNARQKLLVVTADGKEQTLELVDIVRAYPANQLTTGGKFGVYVSRWYEFLIDDPREANSEGGIFPAIFGTIAMTLLMAVCVVPFGVLASLYLREYAKAGLIVSMVRIAINNLAGVPSIVFGVFGMGFFCYIIGAYIDGGPKNAGLIPWPSTKWFGMMAVFAVVACGAFFVGLRQLNSAGTRGPKSLWGARLSFALWIGATALFVLLLAKTPHFEGFYRARLPSPTYGTGGLMWAAMTLALLTLPVVIVATEEALAAVPRSMREGSLACGATKWQTIERIVLPRAMPGIMTGMILAMARGAGEVAPLMLVGALKLAPHLPIDFHDWSGSLGAFPTGPLHPQRSFMHVGFHIYDLGFQSPNSEAAKPMVFTTTLLLIVIIATMNVVAIWMRARLRKKYQFSQF